MEVIPAIDILGGKCVRLYQGKYDRKTIYSDDPVKVAEKWVKLGARRLHIVDLDGARTGIPVNLDVIETIRSSVPSLIQVGGGIRSLEAAITMKSIGVERIIVGTAAVEEKILIKAICDKFGSDYLVISVDARNEYVAVKGWLEDSQTPVCKLIRDMSELGVTRFMYTDITKDGTLTEPNFNAMRNLIKLTKHPVIAAGGISTLDHIQRLSSLGIEAVIVGKAIYTGDIDFSDAVRLNDK